jgi:hypothetical protein
MMFKKFTIQRDDSTGTLTTHTGMSIERIVLCLCVSFAMVRRQSTQRISRVRRRITTFQSTRDRIYDGGPIILQCNIIILTIVLQLPTEFSTVTCCAVCSVGVIGYSV